MPFGRRTVDTGDTVESRRHGPRRPPPARSLSSTRCVICYDLGAARSSRASPFHAPRGGRRAHPAPLMNNPDSSPTSCTPPAPSEGWSDASLTNAAGREDGAPLPADTSVSLVPRASLVALARTRDRGTFYRLWMLL